MSIFSVAEEQNRVISSDTDATKEIFVLRTTSHLKKKFSVKLPLLLLAQTQSDNHVISPGGKRKKKKNNSHALRPVISLSSQFLSDVEQITE